METVGEQEQFERIEAAVRQEQRRRQRLFRLYAGLLTIPILVGVAVLTWGRSDVEQVRTAAGEVVGDSIRGVSQRLSEAQSTLGEIATFDSTFGVLDSTIVLQSGRIDSLAGSIEQVSRQSISPVISAQIDSFRGMLTEIRQEQHSIRVQQEVIQRQSFEGLTHLERQVEVLKEGVNEARRELRLRPMQLDPRMIEEIQQPIP